MSTHSIHEHRAEVEKIIQFGGTKRETAIRTVFFTLLNEYAKQRGLMMVDLHINYETVKPYPLQVVSTNNGACPIANPIAKLKADKESGLIFLDDNTELTGIPVQAWDYKLGNRSTLEWILDQYKESKPKDPTIAEKFNTYRFADYKEQVIDLLKRVCTVSLETMKIVDEMNKNLKICVHR
jgi:predicted helicase